MPLPLIWLLEHPEIYIPLLGALLNLLPLGRLSPQLAHTVSALLPDLIKALRKPPAK